MEKNDKTGRKIGDSITVNGITGTIENQTRQMWYCLIPGKTKYVKVRKTDAEKPKKRGPRFKKGDRVLVCFAWGSLELVDAPATITRTTAHYYYMAVDGHEYAGCSTSHGLQKRRCDVRLMSDEGQ